MESKYTAYYKTPIGLATIIGNVDGVSSITVSESQEDFNVEVPECLKECVQQLDEYFAKERTHFDLKLNPKGTEFQQKVWKALVDVPYGKTRSYLEQSKYLGNVKAIRAVASANGKNPLWIVIPCHRIIGSDGSLTGYAGGIWRKKWLLELECPSGQMELF
ncbi:MAG: cysteine methyltransferase [Flavobacteriaceae bacterium]|nr:MAG: cysteine methyltransferase [Flavobacteriaceae bacterium]